MTRREFIGEAAAFAAGGALAVHAAGRATPKRT